MADFVGIDVRGEKELAAKLEKLPLAAQDAGVEAANQKIISIEKIYAKYRHVSVKQAGGWASDKQRKFVMASIRDGRIKIPYRRTQTLARNWKTYGSGRNQIVANETPYAQYVKDLAKQTMGHMLRGWDVIQTDLKNHMRGIVDAFDGGVKKAIRKLGL